MKSLIRRLMNKGLSVYTEDDLSHMIRRTLVTAMKDARFSDALPDPYLHEISLLAAQSLADGQSSIVLQLVTEDRGIASFLYEIDTTPTGVRISPAREWHVPKKSGDRKIPRAFDGIPRLAIDVSSIG